VFGGKTLTTTDIVVSSGRALQIGDSSAVASLDSAFVAAAEAKIKSMLEGVVDSMKTSQEDVVVYLVGGGSIISPDTLKGVSEVKRFPFADCANAVGACVAQVSLDSLVYSSRGVLLDSSLPFSDLQVAGVVDSVEDMSTRRIPEVQKEVEARAISRAVEAGADPSKVAIIESEVIPVACTVTSPYSRRTFTDCHFLLLPQTLRASVVSSLRPPVNGLVSTPRNRAQAPFLLRTSSSPRPPPASWNRSPSFSRPTRRLLPSRWTTQPRSTSSGRPMPSRHTGQRSSTASGPCRNSTFSSLLTGATFLAVEEEEIPKVST
jgi:hypothetical protein